MARRDAFTCDVCGKDKQQVNHWWMVNNFNQFQLFTWNDKAAEQENMRHLCGQECVTKALSEWMQKATQ